MRILVVVHTGFYMYTYTYMYCVMFYISRMYNMPCKLSAGICMRKMIIFNFLGSVRGKDFASGVGWWKAAFTCFGN